VENFLSSLLKVFYTALHGEVYYTLLANYYQEEGQ